MSGAEILTIAGAAVGAIGSIFQGSAQARESSYQSAILKQQASRERRNAEIEARNYERRQRALLAQARARRAGSGVSIGTGTSLMVDKDLTSEIELGKQTILNQGAVAASRLEQQAGLVRRGGGYDLTAGWMRAGTTLLTGFAEAY